MVPFAICLRLASAIAAEPEEERPLAIPIGREAPVPPEAPPAGAKAPVRQRSGLSEEAARAIREYELEHLELRQTFQAAVTYAGGPMYGGWGWRRYGWGWPYGAASVHLDAGWTVVKGVQPLSVPAYLAVIGAQDERLALERQIRRSQTAGDVLFGVGGLGALTTITGLVAMDYARTPDQFVSWSQLSLGGAVVMIGGLVGGSFPYGRSRTLTREIVASRSLEQVEQEILDHNEALARDLGIDPAAALDAERRPPRSSAPLTPLR